MHKKNCALALWSLTSVFNLHHIQRSDMKSVSEEARVPTDCALVRNDYVDQIN